MSRLTRLVLAHRRLVALFWLAALLAGGYASSVLSRHLSQSFAIPGTASQTANNAIVGLYGSGGRETPLAVVVRLPAGKPARDPAVLRDLAAGFAAVAALRPAPGAKVVPSRPGGPPASRVAWFGNTGSPRFISADGRTTFGLVFTPVRASPAGPPAIAYPAVGQALARALPRGTQVRVTGIAPLAASGASTQGVSGVVEVLIGGAGALAVLAFVFASLLALVPLVIAAVSITSTFLVVLGLTYLTPVNFITQFLVALIGLGVAIDYSLLLVTRWREESARGAGNQEAIGAAMATAGRAVVFSGVTVALGLLLLIALPIPFIRSIGLGGALIPLVSMIVTLTLVPALLGGAGRRLDWPSIRREAAPARGWTAWARLVARRRWLSAVAGLAVLAALGTAALRMHVGDAGVSSLSRQGPARQGVVLLERAGIPTGVLTPAEVLIPPGTRPGRVLGPASRLPSTYAALAPGGDAWHRAGSTLAEVLPAPDGASPAGQAALARLRDVLAVTAPGALTGGYAASLADSVNALYRDFPYLLAGLALITFVLLARAFRSLLLPAKAVLLNLLSVGAVYGVLVIVWQDGHGSDLIWGLPATGAITNWIPLFVFAFLYGLSMDYEVFILSRMREEHDHGAATNEAVITGIGRTGRLVTSAALILFLAMVALASAPFTFLKVFATGLGAGILLDATVVRSLLVPALVCLFGKWNWWLPHWAAAILRVPPSPPRPRAPGGSR